MQIIFLLVFLSYSSLANNCEKLQEQCALQLCSGVKSKVLPQDKIELVAESASTTFTVPDTVQKDISNISVVMNGIKGDARRLLDPKSLSKVVDDLIKNPFEATNTIEGLFQKEFHCVEKNASCEIVTSSFNKYPAGMTEFFRKLSDGMYLSVNSNKLDIHKKKQLLQRMLSEMKGILPAPQVKEEQTKIANLKEGNDYEAYTGKTKWMLSYYDQLEKKLAVHKKDVMDSIRTRVNKLLSMDYSIEAISKKVQTSCKTAVYLKKKIDNNFSVKKFGDDRIKIVEKFEKEFLPSLSQETAKKLATDVSPETFKLMEQESYLPGEANLGMHISGHAPSKEASEVLNDLRLLALNENYGCHAVVLTATDKQDDDKIFISKFTVAEGFGDILSHELGHWLSRKIDDKSSLHSKKKIDKVRGCLKSFYGKEHRKEMDRSEEDFGDWFAAKLNYGKSGFACNFRTIFSLFANFPTQDQYTPIANDSHSNNVFREISMRINRGEKVPYVCSQMMNEYPDFRPKKCDM